MKKFYFLSLIAAFITVLGASAQSNSYNMVIEMTDGTKINIGPNDVKNITFAEGKLAVGGESIDDIKKQIATLQTQFASQKVCHCDGIIEDLKKEIDGINIADILAMINVLQMQIKSLADEVAALKSSATDDDNTGNGESNIETIVGSWVIRGEKTNSVERLTFKSDGTCTEYTDYGDSEPGRFSEKYGTYNVTGNALVTSWTKKIHTINQYGDTGEVPMSEVRKYTFSVSGNNLILTREGKDNSDTYIKE